MQRTFSVWKTIKLGTYQNQQDLNGHLVRKRRFFIFCSKLMIERWASNIISGPEFVTAKKTTKINLVNVSVADLGFGECTSLNDIYKRALEIGLELCPEETGPQLRLQYLNQPKGEWFCIATKPMISLDGHNIPSIFYAGCSNISNKKHLYMVCGYYDYLWPPETRFIFLANNS